MLTKSLIDRLIVSPIHNPQTVLVMNNMILWLNMTLNVQSAFVQDAACEVLTGCCRVLSKTASVWLNYKAGVNPSDPAVCPWPPDPQRWCRGQTQDSAAMLITQASGVSKAPGQKTNKMHTHTHLRGFLLVFFSAFRNHTEIIQTETRAPPLWQTALSVSIQKRSKHGCSSTWSRSDGPRWTKNISAFTSHIVFSALLLLALLTFDSLTEFAGLCLGIKALVSSRDEASKRSEDSPKSPSFLPVGGGVTLGGSTLQRARD